jgi:hypothetical protein
VDKRIERLNEAEDKKQADRLRKPWKGLSSEWRSVPDGEKIYWYKACLVFSAILEQVGAKQFKLVISSAETELWSKLITGDDRSAQIYANIHLSQFVSEALHELMWGM